MMFLQHMRENRRYRIAVIGSILVLVIGIGVWLSNAYAIASVNGRTISIGAYYKNYRAAAFNYEKIKKSYVDNNQTPPELTESDIKSQVISNLIVAELVDEAAEREVGDDLEALIEERIAPYAADENLDAASRELYGIGARDFISEVLIPQATLDILSGRLYLKNQTFDAWLAEARRNATIHIFSDDFSWDGNQVVVK